MKTTVESLDSLVDDPRNARVHGPRNIATIRASVERFGQRRPIVAIRATRVVIAGNGLKIAMQQAGLTMADVLWVDDDAETAAAFALADNRSGELAAWDYEALQEQATTAGEKLTGWTPEELLALASPTDIKSILNKGYGSLGKKPTSEQRATPVALLIMPSALGAVQSAVQRAIQSGVAMSTSDALAYICERYGK